MRDRQGWKIWTQTAAAQAWFAKLYGTRAGTAEAQAARYGRIVDRFVDIYGDGPIRLFSASGRTEVGGNHTDHNHGHVLAAGVSVDMVGAVRARDDGRITVQSEGYRRIFTMQLPQLQKRPNEEGTTAALVRGIAARMNQLGHGIGGFDAYVQSEVLRASGLSSSAAFEVLICTILDGLYNNMSLSGLERAMIAQYAENEYFGKPCGLLDQTACSLGGFVTVDFKDPSNPVVREVRCDFGKLGFSLVITNTGGDHASLTAEYASIGDEMRQVARALGGEVLRDIPYEQMITQLPRLRSVLSERALMRALHFYDDDARVGAEVAALDRGDFNTFLRLVIESGESSWKLLQNCYVAGSTKQPVALGCELSRRMLRGRGAWRVHGGGFAGTIQAFVPNELVDGYVTTMDRVYGAGSAAVLSIRPVGAVELKEEDE